MCSAYALPGKGKGKRTKEKESGDRQYVLSVPGFFFL
jgi:hypothetical protein